MFTGPNSSVNSEPVSVRSLLLAAFLSSLPVCWFQIASAGGLAIRPMHLCLAGLVAVALTSLLEARVGRQFVLFAWFYVIYLCALGMSLSHTSAGSGGIAALVKYGVYFLAFAALYICLQDSWMKHSTVARAVYLGCPLGLLFFCVTAILVFHRLNRNLPAEFIEACIRGDGYYLRWGVYQPLFNESFGGESDADPIRVGFRNMLVGSFLLFIVLVWAYRHSIPQTRITMAVRWGVTVMAGLLILTSLSRANILAAGLVLASVLLTTFVAQRDSQVLSNSAFGIVVAGFLSVVCLFALFTTTEVDKIYEERFSFATLSADPRVEMFRSVTRRIEHRPLLGHGLGVEIESAQGSQRVHNLFLSAWYEAGIFAFFAAVLFWLHIAYVWCLNVFNVMRFPRYWRLPIAAPWVLALPVLPLLRAMLSGQGGNFTLIEWCFLSFFFFAVDANRTS